MTKQEIIADGKLAHKDLLEMVEYFRNNKNISSAMKCIENANRINNLVKLLDKLTQKK